MENEYVGKLVDAIFNKIKEKYEVIETNDKISYEVRKFNGVSDCTFSEYKLHELLNPAGYKISGEIIVSVLVYLPDNDEPRNLSTDKLFDFIFKDTLVQFDEETEEFQICDDINVSYIALKKDIFGR